MSHPFVGTSSAQLAPESHVCYNVVRGRLNENKLGSHLEISRRDAIGILSLFGEQIKSETEKWRKVVEFAGLKVE